MLVLPYGYSYDTTGINRESGMKEQKKQYVRPRLERVELVVQETVLTFCKAPGDSGPMVGACQQSGGPGPCQVRGT